MGGKSGKIPTGARKLELQREYAAARAHRIAVSGRDPKRRRGARDGEGGGGEGAEATAKSARSRARGPERKRRDSWRSYRSARGRAGKPQRAYVVAGRRFTRRDEADAHAKETGRKVNSVALTKEEAARTGEIARARPGDQGREQGSARGRHRGAQGRRGSPSARRCRRRKAAVRTAEGKQLPDKDIEDFLRSRGRDPETVAYLPHNPQGNAAYHTQTASGHADADRQGRAEGHPHRRGVPQGRHGGVRRSDPAAGREARRRTSTRPRARLAGRERGLRHPNYAGIVKKADAGAQLQRGRSGCWTRAAT